MRKLRTFEYFRPASLEEATELLHDYQGRAAILAGGTDLLVSMKHGTKRPDVVVDIKRIDGLDRFTWDQDGGVTIGALFTVDSAARDRRIRSNLPFLADAALAIGHPQVRTRATVLGNLCNASPSADMAPGLLALGASVRVVKRGQEKTIPLDRFFTAPFKTLLAPDELAVQIIIPPIPARTAGHYVWLPKITSVDETLVGVAAVISLEDGRVVREARLAFGSVAPTPIRARKAEDLLRGQRVDDRLLRETARIAAAETAPHSRAEYRRAMSSLLVERALREAVKLAS